MVSELLGGVAGELLAYQTLLRQEAASQRAPASQAAAAPAPPAMGERRHYQYRQQELVATLVLSVAVSCSRDENRAV